MLIMTISHGNHDCDNLASNRAHQLYKNISYVISVSGERQ